MTRVLALALVATLSVGCTEDTPGYCKDDSQCQDKSWEHHEPGKPRCHPITHRCVAATPDGGVDAGLDGPEPDGDTRLENGDPCADGAQCKSGNCVDGVCCKEECAGTCVACDLAGNEGSCTLVPDGQDPSKECEKGSAKCAGVCNGSGACRYPDASQGCGIPVCANGELTKKTCDGSGGCVVSKQTCGGFTCELNGMACKTSCGYSDCMPGFYCDSSTKQCTGSLPQGASCGFNHAACSSNYCYNGVCCQTSCPDECEACNLPGKVGTCSVLPAGTGCATADTCVGLASESYLERWQCDGKSSGCQKVTVACDPYKKCASPSKCQSKCTDNNNCTTALCDTVDAPGTCRKASEVCFVDASAASGGTGTQKQPHKTITACVNSGKKYISIAAGVYKEAITIKGKTVRLVSAQVPFKLFHNLAHRYGKSSGLPAVILESPPSYSGGFAVTVDQGSDAYLYGLRLKTSWSFPGLAAANGSSLSLRSSAFVEAAGGPNGPHQIMVTKCKKASFSDVYVEGGNSVGAVQIDETDVEMEQVAVHQADGTSIDISNAGKSTKLTDVYAGYCGSAGIRVYGGTVDLDRIVAQNTEYGIGFGNVNGSVTNLLSTDNGYSGLQWGGPGKLSITNATVANNKSFDLMCTGATTGTLTLDSAILWTAPGAVMTKDCAGGLVVSYTNLGTTMAGTGNISQDPLFANPIQSDYRLQKASPCKDKGNPAVKTPVLDLGGNPRVVGGIVDMGAYEVQ